MSRRTGYCGKSDTESSLPSSCIRNYRTRQLIGCSDRLCSTGVAGQWAARMPTGRKLRRGRQARADCCFRGESDALRPRHPWGRKKKHWCRSREVPQANSDEVPLLVASKPMSGRENGFLHPVLYRALRQNVPIRLSPAWARNGKRLLPLPKKIALAGRRGLGIRQIYV